AAHDEGRPAGIAVAHRGGVRVLEWRYGEVEELSTEAFGSGAAQLVGIESGPGPANERPAADGMANRERFEDRLDENRKRRAKEAGRGLLAHVEERGWDRVVVTGERHVSQVVAETLPDRNGLRVLRDDHLWEAETPREIADAVWPLLRSVHRDREGDLVERAKDRALSGGNGALGARDVLGALNEGRVAHLLFDDSMTLEGLRVAGGNLLFIEEGGAAEGAGYDLVVEPRLIERMCERAIATDAAITPCDEAAAELLAEYDGVAALLRW
ncbi:MAG TPA: VLRF1 family aeRF1-type release factor, partial [Nitriliruptorales bacterium]